VAKLRNLARSNLKDIPKKIREQQYATPLNGSAIGRKGLRVYDGGWIRIENGGLQVTGTAIISGVLDVTGTTNLSGETNISGPLDVTGATTISGSLDVTGPTNLDGLLTINGDTTITGLLDVTGDTTITGLLDIEGDTTISGTLDITGNTTVASDFEIISGGLFKSGVTTIEPTGKATFGSFVIDPSSNKLIEAPGGWLFTNGPGSIGLADSGSSSVSLNSSAAILDYKAISTVVAGVSGISLNAATTSVSGNLNLTGWLSVASSIVNFQNLSTTSNAPNLYRDPSSGRLYASTWTP